MYLIHRMSHESDEMWRLLKEEYIISIGWSVLSSSGKGKEVIEKVRELTKKEFSEYFIYLGEKMGLEYMTATRSYFLYNFLSLSAGSIVVIPNYREITIVRVTGGPYEYHSNDDIDIGFAVPVEIIRSNASRYEYVPSKISSKLKYQGTNLEINDENECDLIDTMVENIKEGNPIYNFGEIKAQIVDLIHNYITSDLNENHFEFLIKSLALRKCRYRN